MYKSFIPLKEATDYKIYFVKDTLWVAYGQGSGTTSYMPDISKYLTDKSSDKNFDDIVRNLKKFVDTTKPLKTNKNGTVKLYELPFYELTGQYETFDVWGGKVKPTKKYWLIFSQDKIAVVNVFDKKNEALAWIRGV